MSPGAVCYGKRIGHKSLPSVWLCIPLVSATSPGASTGFDSHDLLRQSHHPWQSEAICTFFLLLTDENILWR